MISICWRSRSTAFQDDGIHMDEDMILVAAIGVDANGDKHPLGLVEGATENATTVQALIDNLVERGLDPSAPRLFIIDGSKALSKAIRRTFGRDAAIQRCQVHKARNILERLPKSMHASVKRVLRQAWGNGRRRQSRKAHSRSRAPSRTRLEGRFSFNSGRPRRHAHRHQAETSAGAAPIARLHEHRRERHEHGAARLPKRQILALAIDGPALGRRRHAGSKERLPAIEGAQASGSSPSRSRAAKRKGRVSGASCSNRRGRIRFVTQQPLRAFQQRTGHPRR